MSCKWCKAEKSTFQTAHDIYHIGDEEGYICAKLSSGGKTEAHITIQSLSQGLVNRGYIGIKFCPNCGEDLRVKGEQK